MVEIILGLLLLTTTTLLGINIGESGAVEDLCNQGPQLYTADNGRGKAIYCENYSVILDRDFDKWLDDQWIDDEDQGLWPETY